ncbi:MAG: agglutinin biogenesis protein MshI [Rhodocyclales bacterium GT-UBC]|nr:MAG: agglutinin biogenesis protein MshI [Rhodocyclales bacterium GT-UBC]
MAVVRRGERLDLAHVISGSAGRPEILSFDSFLLEGGESEALKRLAQGKAFKRYRCSTLLAEGDYHLAQLEAPTVPPDERVQALRWRLKDMVDFSVESAALGVTDIPSQPGRQANVFAVAAASDVIAQRMTLFAQARINLEAIDIPEMAVRNVAALFEEANRGLAFLVLGERDSLLTITFQGELCLSRRIELSADALAQDDAERRQQMQERLALELQRTLDNFDRQYSYISVSRLVVASERDVSGLVAGLKDNLYVPVLAMDLAEVADFAALPELRQLERQAQGVFAIGAALRGAA